MRTVFVISLSGAVFCSCALSAEPLGPSQNGDIAAALAALENVGPDGTGHRSAQPAWQKLAALDVDKLPALLLALDHANPLAANWIRSAIDTIVQRQLNAGGALPLEPIEAFLRDRQHAPRARRLAFELLAAADRTAPDRWLPQMLDDPSLELRRDAVARLLDEAAAHSAAGRTETAIAIYRQAISAARDLDQIQLAAAEMKKLGIETDLPRQLGLITHWKVIGPWDNTAGKGYATIYPPEEQIDLTQTYAGKSDEVHWQDAKATDPLGNVDLNRELGTHKEVVGYALAQFQSDRRQTVELRVGSDNAFQLWLNGHRISDVEIYHSSTSFDQYIAHGVLEPGNNQILVKLCQNAQTEDWAGQWKFQLRVCDSTGGAILSEDRK